MPSFHLPKAPWKSDSPRVPGNKTIRDRKHILVSDVNDKTDGRVVKTAAGDVVFENGVALLPADARGRDAADEIRATAPDPKNVAVVTDRPSRWRDPVHRNFWGGWPEMPWKVKDES